MKNTLKILALISAVTVAPLTFAVSSAGTEAPSSTAAVTSPHRPDWLFVFDSPKATLEKEGDHYTLKMQDITNVNAFTDRPDRKAKVLTPSEFITYWHAGGADSFVVDHPNAALTGAIDDKNRTIATDEMVILSHPTYDKRTRVFSFTVEKMTKNEILQIGVLKNASLFLDYGYIYNPTNAAD